MFRTKLDVDKYAQDIFRKSVTENERNIKSLSVAQQYFKLEEYEMARKYLVMYLSVKNESTLAHNLHGECLENLNLQERALKEYEYSLKLDANQPNILMRVCRLIPIFYDEDKAKYWLNKAEKLGLTGGDVSKIRSMVSEKSDTSKLEESISRELKTNPEDVESIKLLLTYYNSNEMEKKAYEKEFKIINKELIANNMKLLDQCILTCQKLLNNDFDKDGQFYANYLFVLDKSLSLGIQTVYPLNQKSMTDCASLIASFDNGLKDSVAFPQISKELRQYFSFQYCFHLALLLYRKYKTGEISSWKEIGHVILPLLVVSCKEESGSITPNACISDNLCRIWQSSSNYRRIQSSLVLQSFKTEYGPDYLDIIKHKFDTDDWRVKLVEKFASEWKIDKKKCLYFTSEENKLHSSFPADLNLLDNLQDAVKYTKTIYEGSLHHMAWIGLYDLLLRGRDVFSSEFGIVDEKGLQFDCSSKLLQSSNVDTLSVLDLNAFLYLTVICTKNYLDGKTGNGFPKDVTAPVIVPADVNLLLCSSEQEAWWRGTYGILRSKVQDGEMLKVRQTVQRGLETIRLIGNHGLHIDLIVKLARTFANQAVNGKNKNISSSLEDRASFYWNGAIEILEKMENANKSTMLKVGKKLFDYQSEMKLGKDDVRNYLEEGRLYLARKLIKEKNYEKAKDMLADVKNPYALTYLAEINLGSAKDLMVEGAVKDKEDTSSEEWKPIEALLKQSLEYFVKSKRLLGHSNPIIPDIASKIDYIESILIKTTKSSPRYRSVPPAYRENDTSASDHFLNSSPMVNSVNTPVRRKTIEASRRSMDFQHIDTLTKQNKEIMEKLDKVLENQERASIQQSAILTNLANVTRQIQDVQMDVLNLKQQNDAFGITDEEEAYLDELGSGVDVISTHNDYGPPTNTVSQIIFNPTASYYSGFFQHSPAVEPLNLSVIPTAEESSYFSKLDATRLLGPTANTISRHNFQIPLPNNVTPPKAPTVDIEVLASDDETTPVEHDPMPDFKPIVPLPDEVQVKTGEENEEILFEGRAKLYRYMEKEWKERGTGVLKILKNKETKKTRVLMRRDIVHKVCANHVIGNDMNLSPMTNTDRAWIYVAHDFADEQVQIEKFCVKFKTIDEAESFKKVFNENKGEKETKIEGTKTDSESQITPSQSPGTVKETPTKALDELKPKMDSFFQPRVETPKKEEKPPNPFATFTFSQSNSEVPKVSNLKDSILKSLLKTPTTTAEPFSLSKETIGFSDVSKSSPAQTGFKKSDTFSGFEGAGSAVFGSGQKETPEKKDEDDFVPSAEFKPAVPLPDLVDIVTGEEGMEILYEERCKLLRFTNKEWKERGIGKMKIMKDTNDSSVRLLMRREQVHKLCCNQRLTREHELQPLTTSDKAWSWYGQDFSEGEVVNELFAIRFKTTDQANQFKAAFDSAKSNIIPSPIKGKKEDSKQANSDKGSKSSAKQDQRPLSELFKPKEGSWECKQCYVRNASDASTCISCGSVAEGKEGTVKNVPKAPLPIRPIPKNDKQNQRPLSELFKPKEGSWECKQCYVRNTAEIVVCISCGSVAEGKEAAAKTPENVSKTTSFNFGIPTSNSEKNTSFLTSGIPSSNNKMTFTFGITANTPEKTTSSGTAPNNSEKAAPFTFGGSQNSPAAFKFNAYKTDSPDKAATTPTTSFAFGATNKVQLKPSFIATDSSDKKESKTELKPSSFQFGSTSVSSKEEEGSSSITAKKDESIGSTTPMLFGNSALSFPSLSGGLFGNDSNEGKKGANDSVNDGNVTKPESEGEDDNEVENDNIHFEPIVPLPDKVPIITGEEDEKVLYEHRAKLFRYVHSEWKERGIGDIKILQHNQTGKIRFLMRRMPIEKICLNHYIFSDMNMQPKDSRSWIWSAPDFSEGQMVNETFAILFKTSDIANEFKIAVVDALKKLTNMENEEKKKADDDDDDDVQIIYESNPLLKVTEEEKELARKLKLPLTFYSYKYKDVCPGCEGCANEEEEGFEIIDKSEAEPSAIEEDNEKVVKVEDKKEDEVKGIEDSSKNVYTSPVTPFSFASKKQEETIPRVQNHEFKFGESQSMFGNLSSFGSLDVSKNGSETSARSPPITNFSFASVKENEKTTNVPGIKFGQPTIFGSSAVFGSANMAKSGSKMFTESSFSSFGSSTSFFGSQTTASSIFGSSETKQDVAKDLSIQNEVVVDLSSKKLESKSLTEKFGMEKPNENIAFMTKESGPSFAALANQEVSFKKASGNFSWPGAGEMLFGGKAKKSEMEDVKKVTEEVKHASDGEDEAEDGDVVEEQDPHFEPIVPLPDKIEVRTGEEEEDIMFGERCKLYRYDANTKEWKERGVGIMKILHHVQNNTFRFLMRREQVHKLVLNERIHGEISLQPMVTNTNSLCWFALNMTDEYTEPTAEKLALRFKDAAMMSHFQKILETCITLIKTAESQESKVEPSDEGEEGTNYYIDEEGMIDALDETDDVLVYTEDAILVIQHDNKFEEEYEDITFSLLYDICRIQGRLVIYYGNQQVTNFHISKDIQIQRNGCECTWKYMTEDGETKSYTLRMSDEQIAMEFMDQMERVKSNKIMGD